MEGVHEKEPGSQCLTFLKAWMIRLWTICSGEMDGPLIAVNGTVPDEPLIVVDGTIPEIGLDNHGNTCYINVVLQMVVHLDAEFLGSHALGADCPQTCAGCLLHTFLNSYRRGSPLNLVHLTREVSCFDKFLIKGKQDDCYLFWNAVVQRLHHLSFQVLSSHRRKCMGCGKESDQVTEENYTITLTIGPGKDLYDSLATYFSWNEVSHHVNCGCAYPTRLKVDIVALPDVLSLRINRLDNNNSKDSCAYAFPAFLDMSGYIKQDGFYYTLYGVIVHVGRSGSEGHWQCFVNSGEKWTRYNDAVVSHSHPEEVMEQEAYMLFYVKTKISEASVSRKDSGSNVPEGGTKDEGSAEINDASSHCAHSNQQSLEPSEHLVGLLDEVSTGFVSGHNIQPATELKVESSDGPPQADSNLGVSNVFRADQKRFF